MSAVEQVDLDLLFYKWMRCELVHNGGLPVYLQIDDSFADPRSCSVRAGGAPDYTVLVSPGWFWFLVGHVRSAIKQAASD